MYALLNDNQLALQDAVETLAGSVGLANPADLGDRDVAKIWSRLQQMGLVDLRRRHAGKPAASGVEVMVCAQALGAGLVPAPFLPSSVLATELMSITGAPESWIADACTGSPSYGLLLRSDLSGLATCHDASALVWGPATTQRVLALPAAGDSAGVDRLALTSPVGTNLSADLTQGLWALPDHTSDCAGSPATADSMQRWLALALSSVCADTVGLMRRALVGAVEYSKVRIAYGVPIGSFQAIQHMAAETLVTIEAAYGATCYAAWCVDEADPAGALLAAQTAKANCASVAITVTENVMQMYGGIGQTWEHIAHFFTRRAIVNTHLFGDESVQLDAIATARLGRN